MCADVQDTVSVVRVNRTPQCNTAAGQRKGSAAYLRSPPKFMWQRHVDARVRRSQTRSNGRAAGGPLRRDFIFTPLAALPVKSSQLPSSVGVRQGSQVHHVSASSPLRVADHLICGRVGAGIVRCCPRPAPPRERLDSSRGSDEVGAVMSTRGGAKTVEIGSESPGGQLFPSSRAPRDASRPA